MLPQSHFPARAPLAVRRSAIPCFRGQSVEQPWNVERERWMAACADRLAELRPHAAEGVLLAVASDLWTDVGGHDPVIAAEMEFEAESAFE